MKTLYKIKLMPKPSERIEEIADKLLNGDDRDHSLFSAGIEAIAKYLDEEWEKQQPKLENYETKN